MAIARASASAKNVNTKMSDSETNAFNEPVLSNPKLFISQNNSHLAV